jgi:hypothetical protein
MSLKTAGKITVFFLLFLMAINLTSAQTLTPGVSPGDTFKYDFCAFWSSTDPEASVPSDLLALNETKFIEITVHQAVGAMVILNITKHFVNGTDVKGQIWVNLLSGDGDGFGLIIAPNLGKNTRAYPLGLNMSNSFVIDEELVLTYPFGEREVLHHEENKTSLTDYRYIYYDMYFDKKTGVMFEWYVEYVSRSKPNEKTSVLWKIKEFNVKSNEGSSNEPLEEQPMTPWPLIFAAVAIVLVFATTFVYRKKKGKRRRSN